MIKDPWNLSCSKEKINTTTNNSFEDNFTTTCLPDSEQYLAALERKLKKLKTNTSVLEQLTERREHCMENLLNGNINLEKSDYLENSDIKPNEFVRQINPEQPINPVELVHIIKHDHLDREQEEQEEIQQDNTTDQN